MRIRLAARLTVAALLVLALGAAACGKKNQTPTETFKAFYEAAKKKDAAAMKKTLSKSLLEKVETLAKQQNKPFEEYLLNVNLPDSMPEVRGETIEGDRATLEYKGRGDSWRTQRFVKEDGEWRLEP